MNTNERQKDEWGKFLSRFHWHAFATPTFKWVVNDQQAKRAAREWVSGLGRGVYAYIAYEKGTAGGRTHCHALLGGFSQGARGRPGLDLRALAILNAKRLWRHGDLKIEKYDPKRGAAWYVAKYPDDGEIIGDMKRHVDGRKRTRRSPKSHNSHPR